MKHRQVISTAYFQSTDFVIAIVQATHLSRFEHATAFTSAYSFITVKAGKVKYTVRMSFHAVGFRYNGVQLPLFGGPIPKLQTS